MARRMGLARVRAAKNPGCRRSLRTRTHRSNSDLWTIDEDVGAVLMLQRRVHWRCPVVEPGHSSLLGVR